MGWSTEGADQERASHVDHQKTRMILIQTFVLRDVTAQRGHLLAMETVSLTPPAHVFTMEKNFILVVKLNRIAISGRSLEFSLNWIV